MRVARVSTALLMLALSACGNQTPVQQASARAVTDKDFDRKNFNRSATVDNRWFPLTPGTRFVYSGYITEEGKRLRHKVVITVTDLTKVIDGVRSVVVYDVDYNNEKVKEAELAFQAQDDDQNVWNIGEYPEEYEDGQFSGAPSTWISGRAGARPGLVIPGHPQPGSPEYLQGWAPAIQFSDTAKVLKTGQRQCITLGCYTDVLVTEEWNPTEPGAHELKYYAPDTGNILVGHAGGKELETLTLTALEHLGAAEMTSVRARALALEDRAYTVAKDTYGYTPRIVV